jgi:hypothetical protein
VPQAPEETPKDEHPDVKDVPPPDRPQPGTCRVSTDCSALELCVNNRCVPPPPQVPAAPPEKHLAAPLTLGIVGVLSAGAGVVFGVLAKQAETQANNTMWGSDSAKYASTANTDSLVANICYGVAAAALVAALIVYLVSN